MTDDDARIERMRSWLARLAASLVDLVLPRHCVGCGAAHTAGGLCAACRPTPGDGVRVPCDAFEVVAAAPYDGPVRTALLAYKERGRRDLAGVLGDLVGEALAAHDPPPGAVLVPVPSAPAAAAARGGDHVLRLARRAAGAYELAVHPALSLVRQVRDSAGLRADERERNLTASMAATPPPAGAVAVIVDDIVTSGATLREAGRALTAAGWSITGAAVVAATPLRTGSWGNSLTQRRADPLAGPREAV